MADKEPCFIGSKVTVKGSISGNQDLVVHGRVEGRVGIENRITVEEEGSVAADVDVTEVTVKGELRGDVVASKAATLQQHRPGGGQHPRAPPGDRGGRALLREHRDGRRVAGRREGRQGLTSASRLDDREENQHGQAGERQADG